MKRRGAGDVLLFQLASRRRWLVVLLGLLALVAASSLYLRLWLSRPGGGAPWWAAILGLYGVAMLVLSREFRSRAAWLALALLATASFAETLPAVIMNPLRLRGAIETFTSLALAGILFSLSRDERGRGITVLESPPSTQTTNEVKS